MMLRRATRLGLLSIVSVVAAMSAGEALAACKNGVCTTGSDDGRTHIVYLTNDLSGFTHYNVIPPGGPQYELHASQFSFAETKGYTYTYSVQACKRGGFMQSSMCTKWAQFTHSVN